MKVWKLLRNTFIDMGIMRFGTETTGGSTTLWTDTGLSLTADNLIGGTLMVISAGSAAPEGEIVKITDNAATTITTAAVTAANAAGDQFGYVSKEFSIEAMLPYVNMALDKVGKIGITDESITTADNQTEYTLPVAIKEGQVYGVYIQLETDDSDDNRWFPIRNWRIKTTTAGNTSLFILDQFGSGYKILIEYVGLHPTVTGYSSDIHESIHPELAKAALKLVLANYRAEGAISTVDGFNQQFNKAANEFDDALNRWPIWKPTRRPKRIQLYRDRYRTYIESDPDKVRL